MGSPAVFFTGLLSAKYESPLFFLKRLSYKAGINFVKKKEGVQIT